MIRFALIGAGFIGTVHAASLAAHPDVDLALVADVDEARARDLAGRHGTRAGGIAEAFDPAAIDAVLIASSTPTHTEYLRRAADAGIAALCEKPIDLDLAAATDTVRHVERSGIPVMIGFNRRFDRDYGQLRRLVESGRVGTVELVQLSSRGPTSPPLDYVKVSGGQMRDQAVHFFDLARWIAGEDPLEVHAMGSALADPRIAQYGDVDTSAITLRLASGALAQIDCVRRTGYGYEERIEVFGSRGLAQARPHQVGTVRGYLAGEVFEDGLTPGWFERAEPTYAASLAAFVAALVQGRTPPVTLRDGLMAQAIAEAATRSLSSGRGERIDYPD